MKAKITQTFIDGLKPRDKYFDVVDTEQPGLRLRVQPSGLKVWYARYKFKDGRRGSIRLAPATSYTPAEARVEARRCIAKAELEGVDPMEEKREAKEERKRTLDGLLDRFLETATIRTAEQVASRIRREFPDLLDRPLVDLRRFYFETWRKKRLEGGAKPATVNRMVANLKSVFSRGVKWEMMDKNPLARFEMETEDRHGSPRYLTPAEEKRLMDALDAREEVARKERDTANKFRRDRGYTLLPDLRTVTYTDHLKPLVLLAMHTGARRRELLHLEWKNVTLDGPDPHLQVEGYKAKSKRSRAIPLNNTARQVLASWRAQGTGEGWVFPGPDGKPMWDVTSAWEKLRRDAKLEGFRWHDLRHHFASKLVQSGAPLTAIRELLGHSDFKLTTRYAGLDPASKGRVVALLDAPSNIVPLPSAATADGQ